MVIIFWQNCTQNPKYAIFDKRGNILLLLVWFGVFLKKELRKSVKFWPRKTNFRISGRKIGIFQEMVNFMCFLVISIDPENQFSKFKIHYTPNFMRFLLTYILCKLSQSRWEDKTGLDVTLLPDVMSTL